MSMRLSGIKHPDVPPAIVQAFEATMNDIAEDMNTYCKQDTGQLKGSMFYRMESEKRAFVQWDTEYAAYAYYKGTPSHDKNPMARLRWAQYATNKHSSQWRDDIAKRAAQLWK